MTKGDTGNEHQSIQEKGALAAVQGIKLGKTRIHERVARSCMITMTSFITNISL